MDSNHRRHTPADLQSAPFGHSGTPPDLSEPVCQRAGGRTRTDYLLITNQLLCQVSYASETDCISTVPRYWATAKDSPYTRHEIIASRRIVQIGRASCR